MTAALLALVLFPAADTSRAPCPGAQVIERAEMVGVVLISDLVDRLDGLSTASIDRFDLRPHVGTAPAGGASWLVLIDGVPVTTAAFGEVDLHLLPVEIAEIDRVTWCPGPAIAGGRFVSAGRLAINTNRDRVRGGLEANGATRIANETGDPGPRRYFPGAAGNVDKIGPDIAGSLGAGPGTVSARWEQRYPTDPATFGRNRSASGRFPMVRYGALGAHVGLPGSARVDAGGAYASDLWYLTAAGRELPVHRAGGQVAFTGGRRLGPLAFGVRATTSGWLLRRRHDVPDSVSAGFDPDWSELSVALDAELRRADTRVAWAAGTHLAGRRGWGPGLGAGSAGLVRAWLHRSGLPSASIRHQSDLAIVVGGDHVGLEGAASIERRFERGSLALTVMRDDHLPEESNGPTYWRSRGYAGLNSAMVPYSTGLPIDRATEWSLRLDARAFATSRVTLQASGVVRDYTGLTLERAVFRPDSAAVLAGTVALAGGNAGRVAAVSASATGAVGPAAWSVSYRYERAVAGGSAFRDTWAAVPQHLARGRIALRPEPLLVVRLDAEARSGASWPAYAAFDGLTNSDGYTHRSAVPAAFVLDAAAERALFDRRLTLTLSLRNLLNVEERTHPLGASLAFRLLVQASYRL